MLFGVRRWRFGGVESFGICRGSYGVGSVFSLRFFLLALIFSHESVCAESGNQVGTELKIGVARFALWLFCLLVASREFCIEVIVVVVECGASRSCVLMGLVLVFCGVVLVELLSGLWGLVFLFCYGSCSEFGFFGGVFEVMLRVCVFCMVLEIG